VSRSYSVRKYIRGVLTGTGWFDHDTRMALLRPSGNPKKKGVWCSHVSQTNVEWLTHEDFRVSEPQHLCCDQFTVDNEAPRLLSGQENEYNGKAVYTSTPGMATFLSNSLCRLFALQSRKIMGSAQLSLFQPKRIRREL